MSNTRATPRPKVTNRDKTFDLDVLVKDGDAPKPLPVRLGGEEFIFTDLDEADYWKELTELDEGPGKGPDIDGQIRLMLGDEQYDRFRVKPLPGWKLRALYERLDEHFGFTKRMGNQGEDDASSPS